MFLELRSRRDQMFIVTALPKTRAPAERDVCVQQYIRLRWSRNQFLGA